MTKVLQFIHGFSMGGAETLVKDYALLLNKKKIDLTILCFENHNSPWDKTLIEEGLRIIYINDYIRFNGKNNILLRIVAGIQRFLLVKKYIKEIAPDVIHQHLPISKYLVFARPAKKTKFVYTQHFDVERLIQNYKLDILATKILLKRHTSRIIAINPKMKEDIEKLYSNSNCMIFNNGIDLSRFNNYSPICAKRKELGISEDAFVIGHVGRFTFAKNHEFLIDVFYQLNKVRKDAHLLLVGDGELLGKVKDKIKKYGIEEKVTIISGRTDIPDLMHIMDVFVFPSVTEGLPLSCIEAQAAGTKCLVSDIVAKTTKVSNLIYYKGLSEGVQSWINDILNFPELNIEYYNIEDWDIKNIVLKLEELYEGLSNIR